MTSRTDPVAHPAGAHAPFTGVGVALVTLFDDHEDIDLAATALHAKRLVSEGIAAIIVCGTTAEADALGDDERLAVLDAVLDAVSSEVPVVMGVGLPSTRQTVELTRKVVARPVAAVLARSPWGTVDCPGYYGALAGVVGSVPLLAYHFPAIAPPGVPLEELPTLPVAGIKDSSGSPERLLRTLETFSGATYVGSALLALMAGAVGADGMIMELANAEPADCLAAFAGDAAAQRRLLGGHLRTKPFPAGIKQQMAERFGTSVVTRMR